MLHMRDAVIQAILLQTLSRIPWEALSDFPAARQAGITAGKDNSISKADGLGAGQGGVGLLGGFVWGRPRS